MNAKAKNSFSSVCLSVTLGLIFLLAGFGKLLSPPTFYQNILEYRLLDSQSSWLLAHYLPWLECLLGLALMTAFLRPGALLLATMLCLLFLLVLASVWLRGLNISCGCFAGGGWLDSVPVAMLKNILMLAAMTMLWVKSGARLRSA
ncbi:MAG: hypothetical protein HC904_09520 [Blastochloris sp.]|nr:hypothetical protein [Blastochloris sp.]